MFWRSAWRRQVFFSCRVCVKLFIVLVPVLDIVSSLPLASPAFMNNQLFSNPVYPGRKNDWHRDGQYHLSLDEQKLALQRPEVIH